MFVLSFKEFVLLYISTSIFVKLLSDVTKYIKYIYIKYLPHNISPSLKKDNLKKAPSSITTPFLDTQHSRNFSGRTRLLDAYGYQT